MAHTLERNSIKISARNQLKGIACEIQTGAVNSIVKINLGEQVITADTTNAAIEDLGLAKDKPALAIIKSTDVMIGVMIGVE